MDAGSEQQKPYSNDQSGCAQTSLGPLVLLLVSENEPEVQALLSTETWGPRGAEGGWSELWSVSPMVKGAHHLWDVKEHGAGGWRGLVLPCYT